MNDGMFVMWELCKARKAGRDDLSHDVAQVLVVEIVQQPMSVQGEVINEVCTEVE